jgi:hypothetical protein
MIFACALIFAVWAEFRASHVPWEANGGMIGWSQSAIEARLGLPAESVEVEIPDTEGRTIRPAPPGPYRTLIFRTFDGHFVAWFHQSNGAYVCFRSHWAEKNLYY